MRIFLYEFVTGGGWYHVAPTDPPAGSLLHEGAAMLRAVAADFAALPQVEPVLLHDVRCELPAVAHCRTLEVHSASEEERLFRQQVANCEFSLLIAPEFDGHLLRRATWVQKAGGRLLGPGPKAIALAGDKHRLCTALAECGLPVPRGILHSPGDSWPPPVSPPVVIKPVDGCGSCQVRLVTTAGGFGPCPPGPRRVEAFVPGQAVSVAVLRTAGGTCVPLPACRQRLSLDGRFTYLGGSLPLAPGENERAQHLAVRAVAALPEAVGYLGVDLVLGQASDGSGDCLIEVNPRLTTSYVGLRQATAGNLAAAQLACVQGEEVRLAFREHAVAFDAKGDVRQTE